MKTIILNLMLFAIAYNGLSQTHTTVDQKFAESVQYLEKNKLSPSEYIMKKFQSYDVIILCEDHRIKQNLLFVQSLIPELYKAGIYNLGMEFGASEDQSALDSLVGADKYDEALARKIMFNYNVAWAFAEYMDIYRKAWEFNRSLPKNAIKFRILNLSYRYDWKFMNGQRLPENMVKVFPKGSPDKYRAELIEREILWQNKKILVLTGSVHGFTHYKRAAFDYISDRFCRYEDGYMGNLLYRDYPDKIYSVVLHQPFSNKKNYKKVSPANGAIEQILTQLGNAPSGFDLTGTPLGDMPDNSSFSVGYPGFVLKNIYDGYIFLEPFSQIVGCTIDRHFLDNRSWNEVVEQSPDPDWRTRPQTKEEYWKQVEDNAKVEEKYRSIDMN